MNHLKSRSSSKRNYVALLLVAAFAQLAQSQWTAPLIYPKSVADNWKTRQPDGSGYDYDLSLTRFSGGLEKKKWVPSTQFQQSYNTTGWNVLFQAFMWNNAGSYLRQTYQGGLWECCLNDLPWPTQAKIQVGAPGPGQFRAKTFNLEMATGGSEKAFKWVLLKANAFEYTSWNGIEPTSSSLLWPSQISLLGHALNPDYRRFALSAANSVTGVTPTATAASYAFDV